MRLSALLLVFALGGCASTERAVDSRFDQRTGLTWVTVNEAVVLARATPRLATSARDYAYLGPVEINRMGEREHYLWLGLASTVDRGLAGEQPHPARTLLIIVDALPMALALEPWASATGDPPYVVKTPLYAIHRARVSVDQISRIARAQSVEVHLISEGERSARYELWAGEWPAWTVFASTPGTPAGDALGNRRR